jgi:UDP-N-acetylglucosamine diphosphorylase/glucosamine-1-phosphate N-acetyltransferase
MQAVILAAGKSTRTYPLTLTRPKVMLPVANKPILQHNLETLRGFIDEAIIVVGYRRGMIEDYFGEEFQGIKMTYAEQKEQLGTGHAVLAAEGLVKGRFIAMVGDDIFRRENVRDVLRHRYSVLFQRVKDPSRLGVWVLENGLVRGFAEKPREFVSDLANCSLYALDEGIFQEIRELKKSERGEYELNEAVNSVTNREDVHGVDSGGRWLSIGYPWNLLEANEALLGEMKASKVRGEIEPNATIRGNVSIGRGTLVKNGVYIEGPAVIGEKCVIGPNCYIRPSTSIGNGCRIGNAVEIKNCIIMDNTKIGHLSYFGDSVLGYDVNIGGGNMAANLRHDRGSVKTYVRGGLVDTGREKFGTVIGDGARTGVNTSIYPGRKIWPGKHTAPGDVLKKDVL